jgi:hypothetical protein
MGAWPFWLNVIWISLLSILMISGGGNRHAVEATGKYLYVYDLNVAF